jgi:hypothetical protein
VIPGTQKWHGVKIPCLTQFPRVCAAPCEINLLCRLNLVSNFIDLFADNNTRKKEKKFKTKYLMPSQNMTNLSILSDIEKRKLFCNAV